MWKMEYPLSWTKNLLFNCYGTQNNIHSNVLYIKLFLLYWIIIIMIIIMIIIIIIMEEQIFTNRIGESVALSGIKCIFTRKYIIFDFEVISLLSERLSYKIRLEDCTPLAYWKNKCLTNHLTNTWSTELVFPKFFPFLTLATLLHIFWPPFTFSNQNLAPFPRWTTTSTNLLTGTRRSPSAS